MGLFQIQQPTKETVVFGVTDNRIVQDVVMVVVFLNLLAQAEDLSLSFFSRRRHCSHANILC